MGTPHVRRPASLSAAARHPRAEQHARNAGAVAWPPREDRR
jgi:hypothetical protein